MTTGASAADTPCTILIAAYFFGYANEIKAELEKRGGKVLWFDDRPATDFLTKGLLRIAPSLVKSRAERYFDRIIDEAKQHQVKDVLVIKGEALSPDAIRRMRNALPGARFTLYFWDSYRNMPRDSRVKVDLFDRAFTFDPNDAAADSRLAYRPLFFLDEYAHLPRVPQDIDVLFVGTAHSDRYAIVKRLARALPAGTRFEKVLYLPSQLIYWARRLADPDFWSARSDEFVFVPVAKADLAALVARSRIVVDIERPIQVGYTMRTIEMLGAGKKLITTNPQVAKADFYLPENVLVIDRKKPVVTAAFLHSEHTPLSEELRRRYSLRCWLDEVLPD